jgi:hypothetical protein
MFAGIDHLFTVTSGSGFKMPLADSMQITLSSRKAGWQANKLALVALGLLLVASPEGLLAQHGGGGRRGASGPSARTADPGLTDFKQALAVQATSDQTSHFEELVKQTDTARKLALEFSKVKERPSDETEWLRKSTALKDAVAETQSGNQEFLKSFSKSQKNGLKELAKKLEKADSEVGKQWKVLEKQLADKSSSTEASGAADLLETALEELQSQQVGLGKEMGIEKPAGSGG